MLFYVDTLEHLRRGGRIGAASALLGSALAIKPMLSLQQGHIQPIEKVRTAIAGHQPGWRSWRCGAIDAAGAGGVDIAVHHLDSPERATGLADRLRTELPGRRRRRGASRSGRWSAPTSGRAPSPSSCRPGPREPC